MVAVSKASRLPGKSSGTLPFRRCAVTVRTVGTIARRASVAASAIDSVEALWPAP
jgi:hypothetical protein